MLRVIPPQADFPTPAADHRARSDAPVLLNLKNESRRFEVTNFLRQTKLTGRLPTVVGDEQFVHLTAFVALAIDGSPGAHGFDLKRPLPIQLPHQWRIGV